MKKSLVGVFACGLIGVSSMVVSCSGDTPDETSEVDPLDAPYEGASDGDLITYLQQNFGTRLTGFRGTSRLVHEDDGTTTQTSSGEVALEGFGVKDIEIDVTYYPASEGGDVSLYVGDVESGDERYFLYNEQEAFIVFSQDVDPENIKGAGVGKLEDGSYEVWVFDDRVDGGRDQLQSVANGYEALRVVEQYNDFSDIDPHVMLTAIAIGHTDLPEARGPISCDDTARKPAVCTIFKEFCDCAACLTLGREDGTCGLCPQL